MCAPAKSSTDTILCWKQLPCSNFAQGGLKKDPAKTTRGGLTMTRLLLCFAALLLISVPPVAADSVLPYPHSAYPAGSLGPLFTVQSTNMSHADVVTLQTLGGVLARTSPSIYVVNSDPDDPAQDDTTVFWLNKIKSQLPSLPVDMSAHLHGDLPGLLRRFRANISGYVFFDPATNSTNAALIRCAGADGNVIAAGTNATAALLQDLGVPRIEDVSSSNPYDAFVRSRPGLSNRMAVFQPDDGSKAACLSAFAVFGRFPVVMHPAGGSVAFNDVLANFASDKINAALGWTSCDEHEFVAANTRAGAYVHASDFLMNLEVLSNLPEIESRLSESTGHSNMMSHNTSSIPAADDNMTGATMVADHSSANAHTVAFMMSDGDNLQLLAGDWISERYYGSPERGEVPMGWSFAAATAPLMPTVLSWVQATMTANDSLQAGPSGAGYAYPELFPDAARSDLFASATGTLMRAANMTVVNPIGVTPSRESMARLAKLDEVNGIVYFTFGKAAEGYSGLHGNVDYIGSTPVVGARMNLWGEGQSGDEVGVEALVRELKTLPKDRSNPDAYSVIVVNMGSHNYSDVVRTVRMLESAGGFDIVLPEALIERLVTRTNRQTACPLPEGPWANQTIVGDLPKCSIAGNGSCIFSCSNILSPLPIDVSCDLRHCHDLTLSASKLHFLCPDGSICRSS